MLPGLASPMLAAGGFDPDAVKYFAAMATQPNANRKKLLNDLIAGLRADGVWNKLFYLHICAAHSQQAGLLNARNPTGPSAFLQGSSFTTDRGFNHAIAGNGDYFDPGLTPVDAENAGRGTTSNHSWGFWTNNTNTAGSGAYSGAASDSGGKLYFYDRPDDNLWIYENSSNYYAPGGGGGGTGFRGLTRLSANTFTYFANGYVIYDNVASSVTSPTSGNSLKIGAAPPNGGYSRTYNCIADFYGLGLTTAQMTALYNRLNTYLAAVGAVS